MILVVGGSGALGSAVVQRLLQGGRAVRVMTRTPEKLEALQRAGVDVVRGDLTDKSSLQRACEGVEQVVASAHSVFGRGREASKYVDLQGHKDLIDVARAVGVQRFVYASAVGAGPDTVSPFFRIKYEIEQYLRGSGLEFVILRATAFMESHVHMLIGQPILEKGKVTLFGNGNNPRNFVAADDVAQFVMIALDDPQVVGQLIKVGGPENRTNMQVVYLYKKLSGRQAKVSHVPLGVLRVMSGLLRPFHPGLSQVMKSSIVFETTDQKFDMGQTLIAYPVTLTKLEDWIRQQIPHDLASVPRMA